MALHTAPAIDLDADGVYPLVGDLTVTVTTNARYQFPQAGAAWQDSGTRLCITDWWSGGESERGRRDLAKDRAAVEDFRPWTGGDAHRTSTIAEASRIYAVEGVHDATAAWNVLADTARAHLVYNRLIAERRERAAEVLREARAEFDQLDGLARFQGGHDRLLSAGTRVFDWGYVPAEDLAIALSEDEIEKVVREADGRGHTPLHLAVDHIAERIGVDVATVRSYRHKKMLPKPDMELGDRAGWQWRTIEAWVKTRRGQGWAAGTSTDESGRRR
ncbi:helix-turn-helix transcriptional regulator [Nocardia sp. NPDC055029]